MPIKKLLFLLLLLLKPILATAQLDSLLSSIEDSVNSSYGIFYLPNENDQSRLMRLVPPVFDKSYDTVYLADLMALADTLLKVEAIPAYTSYCMDSVPFYELQGKLYCIADSSEQAESGLDKQKKLCLRVCNWSTQYHFISPRTFKAFGTDSIVLVKYHLVSNGRVVELGNKQKRQSEAEVIYNLPKGTWGKCIWATRFFRGLPTGGRQKVRQIEKALSALGYQVEEDNILGAEDIEVLFKLQQQHKDWPIGTLNRPMLAYLGVMEDCCGGCSLLVR